MSSPNRGLNRMSFKYQQRLEINSECISKLNLKLFRISIIIKIIKLLRII